MAPLPASEDQLILFVAELTQSRAYSTIRTYLAAVRHLHIVNSYGSPCCNRLKLELALKGARREKPQVKNPRLPITPLVLRKLKSVLDVKQCFESTLLWAVCTGFFGFMRSGEFSLAAKSAYDPKKHLSFSDVSVDIHHAPSMMRLHLRYSKTDQFGQGAFIFLARNDGDLCPVSALLKYLALRGLFVTEDGRPLCKQFLCRALEITLRAANIDPTHYKGHFFQDRSSYHRSRTRHSRLIHQDDGQMVKLRIPDVRADFRRPAGANRCEDGQSRKLNTYAELYTYISCILVTA